MADINPNIPEEIVVSGQTVTNTADPKWIDGGPENPSPAFDIDHPEFSLPMPVLVGLASGFCERAALVSGGSVGGQAWSGATDEAKDGIVSCMAANLALGTVPNASMTNMFSSASTDFMPTKYNTTSNYMKGLDNMLTKLIATPGGYVRNVTGSDPVAYSFTTLANDGRSRSNLPGVGSSATSVGSGGAAYTSRFMPALPIAYPLHRKWMLDELKYTGVDATLTPISSAVPFSAFYEHSVASSMQTWSNNTYYNVDRVVVLPGVAGYYLVSLSSGYTGNSVPHLPATITVETRITDGDIEWKVRPVVGMASSSWGDLYVGAIDSTATEEQARQFYTIGSQWTADAPQGGAFPVGNLNSASLRAPADNDMLVPYYISAKCDDAHSAYSGSANVNIYFGALNTYEQSTDIWDEKNYTKLSGSQSKQVTTSSSYFTVLSGATVTFYATSDTEITELCVSSGGTALLGSNINIGSANIMDGGVCHVSSDYADNEVFSECIDWVYLNYISANYWHNQDLVMKHIAFEAATYNNASDFRVDGANAVCTLTGMDDADNNYLGFVHLTNGGKLVVQAGCYDSQGDYIALSKYLVDVYSAYIENGCVMTANGLGSTTVTSGGSSKVMYDSYPFYESRGYTYGCQVYGIVLSGGTAKLNYMLDPIFDVRKGASASFDNCVDVGLMLQDGATISVSGVMMGPDNMLHPIFDSDFYAISSVRNAHFNTFGIGEAVSSGWNTFNGTATNGQIYITGTTDTADAYDYATDEDVVSGVQESMKHIGGTVTYLDDPDCLSMNADSMSILDDSIELHTSIFLSAYGKHPLISSACVAILSGGVSKNLYGDTISAYNPNYSSVTGSGNVRVYTVDITSGGSTSSYTNTRLLGITAKYDASYVSYKNDPPLLTLPIPYTFNANVSSGVVYSSSTYLYFSGYDADAYITGGTMMQGRGPETLRGATVTTTYNNTWENWVSRSGHSSATYIWTNSRTFTPITGFTYTLEEESKITDSDEYDWRVAYTYTMSVTITGVNIASIQDGTVRFTLNGMEITRNTGELLSELWYEDGRSYQLQNNMCVLAVNGGPDPQGTASHYKEFRVRQFYEDPGKLY